ncbi:WD repeat-containing protein 97-like, partial [Aphidius gifuensis]
MNESYHESMSESSTDENSIIADKKRDWKKRVRVMKERLKIQTGTEIYDKGIHELILYHGLKEIFSTSVNGDYLDICFSKISQEYLLLTNNLTIKRYTIQGKKIQPSINLSTSMSFNKIIISNDLSIYICYLQHDDLIWLLTFDWKLIQIIRNEFRVENVYYLNNEIIVIGPTKSTRYPIDENERKTLRSKSTIIMLDISAGPTWKIDYSSLIDDEPQYLKLAGSYLSSIYIVPLYSDKNEDTNVPVEFLAKKLNASSDIISAIYYHPTSQWIITGDQKGNVIGWNIKLEIMMNCFDDQKGTVKLILTHPSICGFITSSSNNRVQVWSCNLRDKIESFDGLGEVVSMTLNESSSSLAILGGKFNCYHMHQLYNFFSPLTAEVKQLFSTTNILYPTKIIACCCDNTQSILSSANGKQLNVNLIDKNIQIITLASSEITGCIYMLTNNGIFIINYLQDYPMKIRDVWNDEKIQNITYLVTFDYLDEILDKNNRKPLNPRIVYPICTRIIVGTNDGYLMTIDEASGQLQHTYKAHDGSISKLHISITTKTVVSIGQDNYVKIWKIFPAIEKCLAILNYIYYTVPINLVSTMGSTVCIVSNTKLFMYDNYEKIQIQHHLSKDHTAKIIDIATSEYLNICATSSLDRVIKIWDCHNDLIKILQINIIARNIVFSSKSGDIVFNVGKHLYRISHKNYLSSDYRMIVSNEIVNEENDECQIFENENEDLKKILHPVSSVPLGSLDPNCKNAPRLDLLLQKEMCSQLDYRDKDILQIKKGEIEAKKKLKKKSNMTDEQWEKYINDILGLSINKKNNNNTELPDD